MPLVRMLKMSLTDLENLSQLSRLTDPELASEVRNLFRAADTAGANSLPTFWSSLYQYPCNGRKEQRIFSAAEEVISPAPYQRSKTNFYQFESSGGLPQPAKWD